MSYLLEEELTSQGISTKTTLKIKFNNKVYVRVKTLPMQFYEQAKKIKEEYTAKNLDSLIIEHKNWIAIWVEELNKLEEIEKNHFYRVKDLSSTIEDSNAPSNKVEGLRYLGEEDSLNQQKFKTTRSYKKYRGVVYQDNALEKSSDDSTQSQKSIRKYRGVVYQDNALEKSSDDSTQSQKSIRKYRGRSY